MFVCFFLIVSFFVLCWFSGFLFVALVFCMVLFYIFLFFFLVSFLVFFLGFEAVKVERGPFFKKFNKLTESPFTLFAVHRSWRLSKNIC